VLAWNADLRNAVHQALMRAIAKHYLRDAVDDDPGEPLSDELPADDWAAQPGDLTVCWLAKPWPNRADPLELTLKFAVDGWDRLGRARHGAGGVVQWAMGGRGVCVSFYASARPDSGRCTVP
jgi:hypothetical protein